MTLWLQVRGAVVIAAAMALTLVGLAVPASAATATPSPTGATVAAACFLALAVPVAVGWGCGRGDGQLEAVATRAVRWFDLLLAAVAVGLTSAVAFAMHQVGFAPAGAVASRDLLVYLGFLLLAYPFVGWRVAAVIPAVYLLAVAVAGRGEDIYRPALWAWIAANGADRPSWLLTGILLFSGLLAYALVKPRATSADGSTA